MVVQAKLKTKLPQQNPVDTKNIFEDKSNNQKTTTDTCVETACCSILQILAIWQPTRYIKKWLNKKSVLQTKVIDIKFA